MRCIQYSVQKLLNKIELTVITDQLKKTFYEPLVSLGTFLRFWNVLKTKAWQNIEQFKLSDQAKIILLVILTILMAVIILKKDKNWSFDKKLK